MIVVVGVTDQITNVGFDVLKGTIIGTISLYISKEHKDAGFAPAQTVGFDYYKEAPEYYMHEGQSTGAVKIPPQQYTAEDFVGIDLFVNLERKILLIWKKKECLI